MVMPFTSFEFIETDLASEWTRRYFIFPILLVLAPMSYFIYLKLLKQHEGKRYKSKTWTNLRSAFRIFILTLGLTGIFYGTTLSLILLTNATGDIKTINLHATVIEYHTTRNRGRLSHYIKIQDENLNRIVELKVHRPFQVGQQFDKVMKIGQWGLLYSEN